VTPKDPPYLTFASTAGKPANSRVCANAFEMMKTVLPTTHPLINTACPRSTEGRVSVSEGTAAVATGRNGERGDADEHAKHHGQYRPAHRARGERSRFVAVCWNCDREGPVCA